MCNEPATINPDQVTMQSILGDAPGIPESTEQEDQIDGGHTDFALHQEMSTPLVDRFPFGCPGMPTPNKPQCYVHTCQDCIRIGKFSFLIYDGMRS